MPTDTDRAATPDQRRERAERLLARYPDLSDDELAQMLRWFRKEAGIYDIAMVAGNPQLEPAYLQIKHKHLDRLSTGERIGITLFALLVLGAVAAGWMLL